MGDKPGHEFHGNQYTSSVGEADLERIQRGRTYAATAARRRREDEETFARLGGSHAAAKHKAETSTEHTGLDHLREHPVKEVLKAISSIADDVASAIEGL